MVETVSLPEDSLDNAKRRGMSGVIATFSRKLSRRVEAFFSVRKKWQDMQTRLLVTATLVVVAVAVVGGAGASANPGAGATTAHDNGLGANYTVALPNDIDHYPGDKNTANASIYHLAAAGDVFEETSSPKGLKRMDFLTISNQDINFGSCSTENTAAFGLDYGNNNSGTNTDEPLLKHRENSQFQDHAIIVDFFGQGSLAGSPVRFNAIDQIVAVQNECYTMPSEPGWYQINARVNGTGYDGSYIDSKNLGQFRSHYFYICECDSRSEAENKLGPAPSDDSGGSTSTPTPTPTPTATPTPTPTPDSGDSSPTPTPDTGGGADTATPTATPTPTATATPTPTPTPSPTATATATPSPTATATATPSPTATASATASATGTATATTTSGGGGGGQQGGQQSTPQSGQGPQTPTAGAGPGFGVLAALGALLAAGLLVHRRD
jgi:PGF-CTERM protein